MDFDLPFLQAYVAGLWYFSEVGRLEFPYIMSAYLGITAG
jgi:hypothetical protein